MTSNQITTYEYCKNHIECIDGWVSKLPFAVQKYGCGTGQPSIEYKLEDIHREMHKEVLLAIMKAKGKIQQIVEDL